MPAPYQVLATLKPLDLQELSKGYLVTASGPTLTTTHLDSGGSAVQWPQDEQDGPALENGDEDERPKKKQKTSNGDTNPMPNFIKLAVSNDQKFVVAVTDDKLVRVFSASTDGELHELSSRAMPKRPCAIQILPDNSTILCGDKFGDVYSLPMSTRPLSPPDQDPTASEPSTTPAPEQKPSFKPSATNLTVHTARNRKSLQAQMAQKNLTPRKEPLRFEHTLLLGHVSMLTDLLFTTATTVENRSYIITADRDEHIRISRAAPQSHIIEGYCLGHTEFISKICLIPGTPMLVSGGGDDWIGVWEWEAFRLLRKIDVRRVMGEGFGKVDVSGIWVAPDAGGKEGVLVVALERTAALFVVPVSGLREEDVSFAKVEVAAPVVDAVCVGNSLVISLDERRDGETRLSAVTFSVHDNEVQFSTNEELQANLQSLNSAEAKHEERDGKKLDDLLYGVANLRKRGVNEETPAGEED